MTTDYMFELDFKVRDYECDLQGIVNNSVYQNYLEHTRHEFLKVVGLDFAELFKQGIKAVVAKVELAYKTSLQSGDEFIVKLRVEKKGIKYMFYQDIYKKSDNTLCLKGVITSVCVVNGKLGDSQIILEAIERYNYK
ncbi:MAG: acyl-CoA thioesterase [Marinifilaceae bacterium]